MQLPRSRSAPVSLSTQSSPSAHQLDFISPVAPASVPFLCLFAKQNALKELTILNVSTSSPPSFPSLGLSLCQS